MAITIPKDNMTRTLVKRYKYVHHVEKLIAEGEWKWSAHFEPKASDDAWHPSGDCTPSLLDLYEKAKSSHDYSTGPPTGTAKRDISASLYKIFAVGHFWHAYLQALTVRAGLCDESCVERRGTMGWGPEVKARYFGVSEGSYKTTFTPWHWATGSGDLAPVTLPKYGDYLIDFKTMKGSDYRQNAPPAWTADKWECQMNVYMDWFDLEHAIVVGVQKDSPHEMKEFEYVRNQPLIDAIHLKWGIVSQCLEEGIVPPEDEVVELPLKGPITQ